MKSLVESILKRPITENAYLEALQFAKSKQRYIYEREQKPHVLQDWYLAQLTSEYVESLEFSRFTISLCTEMKREMCPKTTSLTLKNQSCNHYLPTKENCQYTK